jgi:hypothetical protein
MINRNSYWRFISLSITLVALLVLSSSISNLKLEAGTLFNQETTEEISILLSQFGEYRGIFLICVAIIPLLFLAFALIQHTRYQQLPAARRNNILAVLLQLIFLVLAFLVIRRKMLENERNPLNIGQLQPPEIPSIGEFERLPIHIPEPVAFLVGFVLLGIIVTLILWSARKREKPPSVLQKIELEALGAISDIEKGIDLRNVILRCYFEMNQAVEMQRGIRRAEGMTPREFENQLVSLGIPPEPVSQLTRLFEDVRYGGKDIGDETEDIARKCLSAIASASKGV